MRTLKSHLPRLLQMVLIIGLGTASICDFCDKPIESTGFGDVVEVDPENVAYHAVPDIRLETVSYTHLRAHET